MPDVWKHWSGQIADGKFLLQAYLGGSDYSAVFRTERHTAAGTQPAAIKLVPAREGSGDGRLEQWRAAARVTHPNLVPLYETGRCELGGVAVFYLVMGHAEENLAQVLAGRPLTASEARAMLSPVLGALGFLHGKGLVHGHVKPTNILANGDRLLLSSDNIRRAGEVCDAPGRPDAYDAPEYARGVIPETAEMTAAGDAWSLGVTLTEALTQQLPRFQAAGGDPALPDGMPEPLREIARHCILRHPQSRWNTGQIALRLEGRLPAGAKQPPARPSATPAPAAPGTTKSAPKPPATAAPVPSRAVTKQPQLPARPAAKPAPRPAARTTPQRSRVAQPKKKGPHIYLYALVALAAVVLSVLLLPRLLRQPAAPAQAATQTVPTTPADNPAATTAPNPAPAPAAAQPTAAQTTGAATAAPPAVRTAAGAVARRVLPNIPQDASNTITGTVRVVVQVDVDATGKVTNATLAVHGPSNYFARKSMAVAPEWVFAPPRVNGQRVASRWEIDFGYTTAGPHASAKQAKP